MKHKKRIFKVLNKARDKWYFIGEGLGCQSAELREIEDRYHLDKARCLEEILCRKIQGGGLTTSTLCTALRGVNRDDLAIEIEGLSFD